MKLKHIVWLCVLYQSINTEITNTSVRLLDAITMNRTTWKAGYNFPEGTSTNFFKQRLGYLGNHPNSNFEIDLKIHTLRLEIPQSFDAREHWPACKNVIDNIRNQGNCGSCWAFSVVEVMSDRLCIQTKGATKIQFSAQDLLSCCPYCGYGCDGGYTYYAWRYWQTRGIVSGGDYDSNEGCKPYEALDFYNNTTPPCRVTCPNGKYDYNEDKHFGDQYYGLTSEDVQQIQVEIMTKGPVQASYQLYEDFMFYKEGVYRHVTGQCLGGHTVKIIGWGTEEETPYWLVANSWGTTWATLNGYFKIKRGSNECGIEENVIGGETYILNLNTEMGTDSSGVKLVFSSLGLLLAASVYVYMKISAKINIF